ncbi:hypothetical protein HDU86_002878 [Geranomyces michiganensis]|nr:hypothetical protein HDU86_002878 [Geranomyces michiganensis]
MLGNDTTACPRHVHRGADVRVVVGQTHFDVHSQILALYSEYFRALFDGPWATALSPESNLRIVKPGDIVNEKDFGLFLDFIYLPAAGEELILSADNVVELEATACALHVAGLRLAVKKLYATNPKLATWQNVEELLIKASSKQLPLEHTRAHCAQFLASERGAHWVRTWYLAEQHKMPELTENREDYRNLPRDPWSDPFFAKLSDKLRSELLLARMQDMEITMTMPNTCGRGYFRQAGLVGTPTRTKLKQDFQAILPQCPHCMGQCTAPTMSIHAPTALTTYNIAETVVTSGLW